TKITRAGRQCLSATTMGSGLPPTVAIRRMFVSVRVAVVMATSSSQGLPARRQGGSLRPHVHGEFERLRARGDPPWVSLVPGTPAPFRPPRNTRPDGEG